MKNKEIPTLRSYQFIIAAVRMTTYPDFQEIDSAEAKRYASKEKGI